MSTRTPRLAAFLIFLLPAAHVWAVELKNRSTSSSGQFVVYCDDRPLRGRVTTFVEEVKADIVRTLRSRDQWTMPIVVTIDSAESDPPPPVRVQLVNTLAGPKIDVIVRVGRDPSQVFLQRHIIRAVLLEMIYHDRPRLKHDEAYSEAPWWLVEGVIESARRRENGGTTDVFKSIMGADQLPPLESLLGRPSALLDTAAGIVDRACALCLFEALLTLPSGAENLHRFLSQWPEAKGDAMAALKRAFPELNSGPQSLSKWWALQLSRFAKGDQWQGQSLAETDKELSALLTLTVTTDKKGTTKAFPFADFENYVKLPGAAAALHHFRVKIVTLSTSANPLFRSILTDYESIASALSVKKTKGIAARIADAETYRTNLIQRMGAITDYLNWYEATQSAAGTDDFGKFLRAAAEMQDKPKPVTPPDPRIVEYLDDLEKEFAPLRPNTMPGGNPDGAASR